MPANSLLPPCASPARTLRWLTDRDVGVKTERPATLALRLPESAPRKWVTVSVSPTPTDTQRPCRLPRSIRPILVASHGALVGSQEAGEPSPMAREAGRGEA